MIAIAEREKEILSEKNKEIKVLEESILAKDALLLEKEKISDEQLTKKDDEIKQYQISLLKKDDEINSIRVGFSLEKQEIKLEKDKSLDEMRLNNSKQLEENAKRIIELQSYIRAKEDELSKTRAANENFMMNKFEATFGRFIEKSKTSAGTGLIGEGFVEQILSKIGFGIHYENVARWGHQGDFKIVFPKSQVTILLEVKNFSDTQTSLPRKDIDKFFLDLKDSSYHAGILLSLNSQCKMDIEDLSIQDDPKSRKKFMFLSKFVSIVKGDHDFALRLALNVLANAVLASRTNNDDTSKEMLTFIKSQLEFMRLQYKAAQSAEKEAAKTAMSLRDNINKITRQITDWENPRRPNRRIAELFDFRSNTSPSKCDEHLNSNQIKDSSACGILAQPVSKPCSPWERRSIVTGENSPKTPKLNKRVASSDALTPHNAASPNKLPKINSEKMETPKSLSSSNIASASGRDRSMTPTSTKKENEQNVDNHGFLNFNSATSFVKPQVNEKRLTPESQVISPNDTDDIFKSLNI